jgi:hypothetical protein
MEMAQNCESINFFTVMLCQQNPAYGGVLWLYRVFAKQKKEPLGSLVSCIKRLIYKPKVLCYLPNESLL